MQIRYSSSDLTALAAAYIALTSVPSSRLDNLVLEIPRESNPNSNNDNLNLRKWGDKGFKVLFIGNILFGILAIFGMPKPQHIYIWLITCLLGGSVSILASLDQLRGVWRWVVHRQSREGREDVDRLEKVLRAFHAPRGASGDILQLSSSKGTGVVELDTRYGILETQKAGAWHGYKVTLRKGGMGMPVEGKRKEEEVTARIEWAGENGIKGSQSEWVRRLNDAIEDGGDRSSEYLISLYQ